MTTSIRGLLPSTLLLGLLLAGCGGGSDSPEPTPIGATLTVSSATSPAFNGVYTTGAVNLAEVVKLNPAGSEPEVCSFRFSGLSTAGGAMLDGDIRYLPGTNSLHVIFVSINGFEFSSRTATSAAVDRANNEIDLAGKVLTASTGVASTITVTGSVPMRAGRPEGC
jgi:hypothetical protein